MLGLMISEIFCKLSDSVIILITKPIKFCSSIKSSYANCMKERTVTAVFSQIEIVSHEDGGHVPSILSKMKWYVSESDKKLPFMQFGSHSFCTGHFCWCLEDTPSVDSNIVWRGFLFHSYTD